MWSTEHTRIFGWGTRTLASACALILMLVVVSVMIVTTGTFAGRHLPLGYRVVLVAAFMSMATWMSVLTVYSRASAFSAIDGRACVSYALGWKRIGAIGETVVSLHPGPDDKTVVAEFRSDLGSHRRQFPRSSLTPEAIERGQRLGVKFVGPLSDPRPA